jgi:hypothetical protein
MTLLPGSTVRDPTMTCSWLTDSLAGSLGDCGWEDVGAASGDDDSDGNEGPDHRHSWVYRGPSGLDANHLLSTARAGPASTRCSSGRSVRFSMDTKGGTGATPEKPVRSHPSLPLDTGTDPTTQREMCPTA